MPVPFSAEQVAALAPDAASVKAGRSLTNPAKWPALGCNDQAAWGECQGSGAKPYQTQVDFTGPGFKCSCPSRKFPCKHGLGLLFMAAERPGSLKEAEPPDWVAAWLQTRRDKVEKKAATVEAGPKAPTDPEAVAKRVGKRLDRMKAGAEDLSRWMADQLRHGLATWPQQPSTHWNNVAARMVDHQMPALEVEVRRLGGLVHTGEHWPVTALRQMGRLHLRLEGVKHFDALEPSLQADLRAALGWALDKEEILSTGEKLTDDWTVMGQVFTERERLWERRTWLQGQRSGRFALMLDFSHGSRAFETPLVPGTVMQAEVVYHPSAFPQRVSLSSPPVATAMLNEPPNTVADFTTALQQHAVALAANPWLMGFPLVLEQVTPVHRTVGREQIDTWSLRDRTGAELPLSMFTDARHGWELLALSGGHPLTVFGEWVTGSLQLMSCWQDGLHVFQDSSAT